MELYFEGFLVALRGVPATVGVSIFAVTLGAILGLGLALMKTSSIKPISLIARIYIEVVRGTPMIVQALVFAYGLPQIFAFKWPELIIPAMIVCGLNSAAYMAEVIRGGIQAVPMGQVEAARSMGMSKAMAMRLIIIPQAFRIVIPSLGNEFVTLIKETSVLAYVGVVEILRKGVLWCSVNFETFPAYIGVALVYLMLTYPLSKLVGYMEKKMENQGGKAA